jgi:phospholipase/lecithinase/hemolysin
MRPVSPVAQRNMKQTVVNMILGFPQLFLDGVPLWSQFEYAKAMNPTLALVELGYYEALDAAVNGDTTRMPDPSAFGTTYSSVLAGLRALQTQVIATTIPNPLDTAYFNTLAATAALTSTSASTLADIYPITSQDYVTRNGLLAIGVQFLDHGVIGNLPAGSVLTGAVAADLTTRVNALNAQIATAAKANGAVLYDLNAFLHKIKVSGATAGSAAITAGYLGGFYSLDAVYPGATGHALIANDILAFLNQTYQQSFPLIDVSKVVANDPTFPAPKPGGGN